MQNEMALIPDDLRQRSASDREIVLPFADAISAIRVLAEKGITEVGWEGRIKYPDGRLGHSKIFQGTSEYFLIENCIKTICEDQEHWESNPEIKNGQLLFCLFVREKQHPIGSP